MEPPRAASVDAAPRLPTSERTVPGVNGAGLRVRLWSGGEPAFLLVHGLASNARLWDGVAARLAAAGHAVVAVDLRGHGRSEKPDDGYDLATVVADLVAVIAALCLERPLVVGQSWGGNVALELAYRHPERVRGIVGVDGGTIELRRRFPRWEDCAAALAPPRPAGLSRAEIEARIRDGHPDWPGAGVAATLANFETLPGGTVRPWLTRERHMAILRALWEHTPSVLYPRVTLPVLLLFAVGEPEWTAEKRAAADAAAALPTARVRWLEGDHDLHAQQPGAVAAIVLGALADGFFGRA